MNTSNLVKINIRGQLYLLPAEIFQRKKSLFNSFVQEKKSKFYHEELGQIYLNVDVEMFEKILNYHTTDELHFPHNFCLSQVKKELEFWQVEDTELAPCCWNKYYALQEQEDTQRKVRGVQVTSVQVEDVDHTAKKCSLTTNKCGFTRIWKFLDDPHSSKGAMIFQVCSSVFTLMFVIAVALDSCIDLRIASNHLEGNISDFGIQDYPKILKYATTWPHPVLDNFLFIGLVLLTIELLLRVIVCPNKLAFFISPLNIIDILSLTPLWAMSIIYVADGYKVTPSNIRVFMDLRIIAILLELRLVRHLSKIKLVRVMSLSIKSSANLILFMGMILIFTSMLFSALVYIAEIENPEFFWSLPEGFYWSIITMTTVGYGDIYPKTTAGCVVAALCAVSGIVVLAMPIPILSAMFHSYHDAYIFTNRLTKRKQKQQAKEENKLRNTKF